MARAKTKFKIDVTKEIKKKLEDLIAKTSLEELVALSRAISLYSVVVDANKEKQFFFFIDNTANLITKVGGMNNVQIGLEENSPAVEDSTEV